MTPITTKKTAPAPISTSAWSSVEAAFNELKSGGIKDRAAWKKAHDMEAAALQARRLRPSAITARLILA